jgi:succinate dehydrogenase / fumarate reductase cytochrome b subunit
MAVSGAVLLLFVVAHMLGNLKIFVGAAAFDHYAHWLRDLGTPLLPHTWYLWIQRGVLTFAVLAHLWSATALALRARAAHPVRYAHRRRCARELAKRALARSGAGRPVQGSYAARTMRWGGVIIALFVVYHILDLTTGHLNPIGDHQHPYANVVADFAPARWPVTLCYALAIVAIGFHLRHGIASALRSLGQSSERGARMARRAALGTAVVLCAGYLSVPFAVITGLVG